VRSFAERVLPVAFVNGRQATEQEIRLLRMPDEAFTWSLEQVTSIEFWPD
jgi:hypothetical protein